MVNEILKDISELKFDELKQVGDFVDNKILADSVNENLMEDIYNKKYPVHICCPECGSVVVVKYGKYNGKQRYKCKDCNKTFGLFTNSIAAKSKIPLTIWSEFAKCMLSNKASLREISQKLSISLPTAFRMRHKLLGKLSLIAEQPPLGGKVQIDETYIPESFCGNHSKSKTFTLPRAPYKRGSSRSTALNDKSCIITAIDNGNNILLKREGLGKPRRSEIDDALLANLHDDSILITDGLKAYTSLADDLDCQHEVVVSSIKKNSHGYTLNYVNSLHSSLKRWIRLFNGVATKYLDNYLTWFIWLERNKSLKNTDLYESLLVDCLAT